LQLIPKQETGEGVGLKVNCTDLAAIFGVSQTKIDSWAEQGLPYSVKPKKNASKPTTSKDYIFDTTEVIEWCIKNKISL